MRIVIIGGGPAGYEAALVAAEHHDDVTLVSSEGLGGNSVLWDCVPSKALIVSADAMGWMQSADRLGVRLEDHRVAEGSSADMASVLDRVARLAKDQSADIEQKVCGTGVRYVPGRARLTSPTQVEVTPHDGDTHTLDCDMVLICTGSNPRVLPFFEPDGERVFTARELFKLRELPERLIVVGSGPTGAEYAHAFARFGSEVHLVSSREQVLPSEDPDAAKVIEDSFERWGMTIHRERRAVDVEVTADGVRVHTEDSKDGEVAERSSSDVIEGSHVLFCVGQVPASEGLGLEEAGVDVDERGFIPVDGVSRTNLLTVYAAGDVTGGMMLASTAAMRGRNAVWHFLGKSVQPLRSDVISRCVFTNPEVASVGLPTQKIDEISSSAIETVKLDFAGNPRAKMTEHTRGFVKLHARRGSGTVLGGVVVADSASDLITPLSVAVRNRLTVEQVAHAFTIYPSMAGSIQETARQILARQPDEAVY